MPAQRNIRLLIAFDGTGFNGWQRQKHKQTIQGEIEQAIARMANANITLHGAGRTDAGVHADGMVAHFLCQANLSCGSLQKGLNSILPEAIRILAVEVVGLDFHSRFQATGKHYVYFFYTGRIMDPKERLHTLHAPYNLDFAAIEQCLQMLLGKHDFSTFENSGSRDKTYPSRKGAVRTLTTARLEDLGKKRYCITIIGEGFLRQMVRNIVGTLLEVGKGRITVAAFKQALLEKDRSAGGPTAPAHGLTLKRVLY